MISRFQSASGVQGAEGLPGSAPDAAQQGLEQGLRALGFDPSATGAEWNDAVLAKLPFLPDDLTAGSESELQTAVIGSPENVDLPQRILTSNYFANVVERSRLDHESSPAVSRLEAFVQENPQQVWENSWVRFPLSHLNAEARARLDHDLLADKSDPAQGRRSDERRFFFEKQGQTWLRVPISYLLILALAQLQGAGDAKQEGQETIMEALASLMPHFLNDNSSPETFSFQVSRSAGRARHGTHGKDEDIGQAVSRETRKRFLLTHLLLMYANRAFHLNRHGQHALVYYSPHAPVRLQDLNDSVSDSFFRKLFLSPCLSGWDKGKEKFDYMKLCHQVLSRSRLNGLGVLREAGIINNNLVLLPHTSNLGLANNGTHLSLGSERLDAALADPHSGFDARHEKWLGDLNIKITEHFLPLFVDLYSAAPYRLDYQDFHPETALGFLPHELHYTHLRMHWRNWKFKAGMTLSGLTLGGAGKDFLTPMGPKWIDDSMAFLFRQKGDLVPDYRLIDYLVSLSSTDRSAALDGSTESQERLLEDLDSFGVFDSRMSLYLLYKQRIHAKMGFSGFEARYFSLFQDLDQDLRQAANLQALITAVAFKLVASGQVRHEDIPDTRFVESERRQFFFAAATGLRAGYVRKRSVSGKARQGKTWPPNSKDASSKSASSKRGADTSRNYFLLRLLKYTRKTRASRRFRGYRKVYMQDYRLALLRFIETEAADVVEAMGMQDTLSDLRRRIEQPEQHGVAARLTQDILEELGEKKPLSVRARSFNQATEDYYRHTLRRRHLASGLEIMAEDLKRMPELGGSAAETLQRLTPSLVDDHASEGDLTQVIHWLALSIQRDRRDQKDKPAHPIAYPPTTPARMPVASGNRMNAYDIPA